MISSNLYPFASKSSIKARILEDNAFMQECLQIMLSRQTAFEQDTRSTRDRNKQGFMSSHAVNGTRLAILSFEGPLTGEDLLLARKITQSYSKQLASHFRTEAVRENPALKSVAALFSAE